MQGGLRIAMVGVSYLTNQQSSAWIDSIVGASSGHSIDIFLVNNSAAIAPMSLDHGDLQGCRLQVIEAPDNPGYFGGAYKALKNLSLEAYDFVVVSNVDLVFTSKTFFSSMTTYVQEKDIGVLAPSIVSGISKKDSNPYMLGRPSRMRMLFYSFIFSNYLTAQAYSLLGLLKKMLVGGSEGGGAAASLMYAPHGSCIIFSKEFFQRGGSLQYGAYMYGEEVFVGEWCRRLGLKVKYAPELSVYHEESVSTGRLYSRRVLSWKKHSSLYLWKTFFK